MHKWLAYCFDENFNLAYERNQSTGQKPEISLGAVWDFFGKTRWVLKKNAMDLEVVRQVDNGMVKKENAPF